MSNGTERLPNLCPTCKTLMDATYDDGGGDFGDEIEEQFNCETCGYWIAHTVGSSSYYDENGHIYFDILDSDALNDPPDGNDDDYLDYLPEGEFE